MPETPSITPEELRQLLDYNPEACVRSAGFYVYEHWRPDKEICFYVGKGRGKRAYDMSKRNAYHRRVCGKLRKGGLRVRVVIVAAGLSEVDAFALEKQRIAYWRESGQVLANLTDGGEGAAGFVMPDEVKLKIGSAHKGKTLSEQHRSKLSAAQKARFARPDEHAKVCARNTGRKQSPETIAKRASAMRGRKMPQEFCDKVSARKRGTTVPPEVREKIRKALTGRKASAATIQRKQASNPFNKAVRCLDTGEVFRSASEAARQMGLNRVHLAEAARGARKRTGGFSFEYLNGVQTDGC